MGETGMETGANALSHPLIPSAYQPMSMAKDTLENGMTHLFPTSGDKGEEDTCAGRISACFVTLIAGTSIYSPSDHTLTRAAL